MDLLRILVSFLPVGILYAYFAHNWTVSSECGIHHSGILYVGKTTADILILLLCKLQTSHAQAHLFSIDLEQCYGDWNRYSLGKKGWKSNNWCKANFYSKLSLNIVFILFWPDAVDAQEVFKYFEKFLSREIACGDQRKQFENSCVFDTEDPTMKDTTCIDESLPIGNIAHRYPIIT
mgnify:CR=1 FL=1